jgi:hypothetical protein
MATRTRLGSVPAVEAGHTSHAENASHGQAGIKVAIAALGVVYGDIGTSPLYALRECFLKPHGVAIEEANVMGVLSLFFWSLTLVIVVKYLTFVLRADNNGEGCLNQKAQPSALESCRRDLGSSRSSDSSAQRFFMEMVSSRQRSLCLAPSKA